MDTKNGGPVFWMSENYVCPNCVKEPGDRCCQSPPEGAFCTPDTLNMTQKTPQQLKRGCERFSASKSSIRRFVILVESGYYRFHI